MSLCLDSDSAGAKATARIEKQLFDMGFGVRVDPPQGKDWNDDLVALRQAEACEMRLL